MMLQGSNKGKMKMFCLADVPPTPSPGVNRWKSVKINQINHSNLGDAQKERVFFGIPSLSCQTKQGVWRFEV